MTSPACFTIAPFGCDFFLLCSLAEYVCHVFVRSDSLGGVIVSYLEYPQRVVFTLLNKVRSIVKKQNNTQ